MKNMMATKDIKIIVVLLFVAAGATDHSVTGSRLGSFFAADKQVELTRASELNDLVKALAASPEDESVYSQRSRLALQSLNEIINAENDSVCSPEKVNQIRSFYSQFVDEQALKEQQEKELPRWIKNLFLSYGFGVSRVCKTSMVPTLLSESQRLLSQHDFDQIDSWTSEGGPIAKVIKTPKDVDDLVLPEDILAKLRQKFKTKGARLPGTDEKVSIVLEPATSESIRRIQAVCERRFRPIYEQLIMPLVSLSRVGLNYKGSELSAHLEQTKTNKEVHLWYRIVYLCESLAKVEVLVDTEDAAVDTDKKTVRVLSKEEADELRLKQQPGELDEADVGAKIEYHLSDHRKLDDLIVDLQDKNLHKLVEKFEAHKNELRRMRSKVVKQMMSIVKEHLKGHKVNLIKGLLKKGRAHSLNGQLVEALNEYVDLMETNPGAHTRTKRSAKDFLLKVATFTLILIPFLIIIAGIIGLVFLG